jgi:outer membrane immunogenic protein
MSVAKLVRTGAAALGVLIMAKAVLAADFYGGGYKDQAGYPPPNGYKDQVGYIPPPIWQGFYFGGNIGGAWSSIEPASNVVFLGATPGTVLVNRSIDDSNIFGGVQAGYNIQAGNFLYGLEADLGGMGNGARGTFVDASTPARALQINGTGGWYGDITGRGGVLYGNALFYAKGGFAFFTGDVSVTDNFDNIHQNSGTFAGWTIGAGFEYMFSPRWTVKFEYMYYDFGNNNFSCCSNSTSSRLDTNLTANTIKVGFNFLLNSRYGPLY